MNKLGVILAGGNGSRLYPLTEITNKHLLPVYNKPMIYYPISTLLMLGCDKIIILTNLYDKLPMEKIQKKLNQLNINSSIKFQGSKLGIPSALLDAIHDEKFDELYAILGDNIFFGKNFINDVLNTCADTLILTKKVKNYKDYGILKKEGNRIQIVEKPKTYISNDAVTGFYKFNSSVKEYLNEVKPSERGETEIADVLNNITEKNENKIKQIELNRATLWLDAGTFENLTNSNSLVYQIVQRQGQDFGCIEESALEGNYIDKNSLKELIQNYPINNYRDYIYNLLS